MRLAADPLRLRDRARAVLLDGVAGAGGAVEVVLLELVGGGAAELLGGRIDVAAACVSAAAPRQREAGQKHPRDRRPLRGPAALISSSSANARPRREVADASVVLG